METESNELLQAFIGVSVDKGEGAGVGACVPDADRQEYGCRWASLYYLSYAQELCSADNAKRSKSLHAWVLSRGRGDAEQENGGVSSPYPCADADARDIRTKKRAVHIAYRMGAPLEDGAGR